MTVFSKLTHIKRFIMKTTFVNQQNTQPAKPAITASLAPMAGFTDCVFRRICANFGAAYTVSEMISAMAMVMGDRKTAEIAEITEGEAPVVLQLFGHDPEVIAKAAAMLLDGSFNGCRYAAPPAGIDLNMGCPVKKIVTTGDGSALMKNVDLARRITSAAAEVCEKRGVPLSVKFRLGWDESSINAPEFAAAIAQSGAKKITLHTRTREQMYAPSADPARAADVYAALADAGYADKVTLVGNGDIDGYDSAAVYLANGCSEIAVGRAALGNPWIFAELSNPVHFVKPTIVEIVNQVIGFVHGVVELKGEEVGIRESRGRAAHFIKGLRGSASVRDRLNHACTLKEFEAILRDIG